MGLKWKEDESCLPRVQHVPEGSWKDRTSETLLGGASSGDFQMRSQ